VELQVLYFGGEKGVDIRQEAKKRKRRRGNWDLNYHY
jgi:hypothetical protein